MAAVRRLVQGHPRSSILVPIESSYATSYKSLMLTLHVSHTVFKILTHKVRKYVVFPTPPLFDAPAQAEPVRISGWTYAAKTRWMRLLYGENCMTLSLTVFNWKQTDGQTGGRAMAYTCYRIYVVSCKNRRKQFCRGVMENLQPKNGLIPLRNKKEEAIWSLWQIDTQTDRQSQLLTIVTPRLGVEINNGSLCSCKIS